MCSDLYLGTAACSRGRGAKRVLQKYRCRFFFFLYIYCPQPTPAHLGLFWDYVNNLWNVWHQRSVINISQFHCAASGSGAELHSTSSPCARTMQIRAGDYCRRQNNKGNKLRVSDNWKKIFMSMMEPTYLKKQTGFRVLEKLHLRVDNTFYRPFPSTYDDFRSAGPYVNIGVTKLARYDWMGKEIKYFFLLAIKETANQNCTCTIWNFRNDTFVFARITAMETLLLRM